MGRDRRDSARAARRTSSGPRGAPVTVEGEQPSLRELLGSDVDRYVYMLELDGTAALRFEPRLLKVVRAVLMCQGLKASLVHRVGHALAVWSPPSAAGSLLRLALRVVHWVVNRGVEAGTGISISEHAVIGRGLYIAHFGGVIVGPVRIGDHCNLSQGVTLGRSGRRGQDGRPQLGDRVWIGPGAVVVGGLEIGDDAVIGANSVVTRSVPARCSALGAPSVVRPGSPSFDMVVYRSADEDGSRRRSLALAESERAERVDP